MGTPHGVEITGPMKDRYDEILTTEALEFLADLHRRFEPRRQELLAARKRRQEEEEECAWFCENCDALVLSRVVNQGNIPSQVSAVYSEFNADEKLRTCRACGYVFPVTPMAERLSFLDTKQ